MSAPSSKSKRKPKSSHSNLSSPAPNPSSTTTTTAAAANKPATLSILQHLESTSAIPLPTSAQEIHSTQIAHKPLILWPTSPDPTSQDARSIRRKKHLSAAAKQRAKKRPKPLSAREKRVLGVYDLELTRGQQRDGTVTAREKTAARWDVWKGLWTLWCGYVWEVFGLQNASSSTGGRSGRQQQQQQQVNPSSNLNLSPAFLGPKISSLDLHGALLRVVKSNCASLVGVWGVCVRENKFSILLVDSRCVVRRVTKRGVVFAVEVPLPTQVPLKGAQLGDKDEQKDEDEDDSKASGGVDLDVFLRGEGDRIVFELSGKAFECRPTDRATKKFKARKYDGF